MGWYPCCCEPPDCTTCSPEEVAGTAIELILAGIADGACTACGNVNGTWVLPYYTSFTSVAGPVCVWSLPLVESPSLTCFEPFASVNMSVYITNQGDGTALVQVFVERAGYDHMAVFEREIDLPNCSDDVQDMDVPFVRTDDGSCIATGSSTAAISFV